MKKFLLYFIFLIFITIIVGFIVTKSDIIVKENSEYIYVKRYTLFNIDSVTYKYHKPITYTGTVIKKEIRHSIAGKVWSTRYLLHIRYDNTEKKIRLFYQSDYKKIKENDKIEIKETYYPQHVTDYYYEGNRLHILYN